MSFLSVRIRPALCGAAHLGIRLEDEGPLSRWKNVLVRAPGRRPPDRSSTRASLAPAEPLRASKAGSDWARSQTSAVSSLQTCQSHWNLLPGSRGRSEKSLCSSAPMSMYARSSVRGRSAGPVSPFRRGRRGSRRSASQTTPSGGAAAPSPGAGPAIARPQHRPVAVAVEGRRAGAGAGASSSRSRSNSGWRASRPAERRAAALVFEDAGLLDHPREAVGDVRPPAGAVEALPGERVIRVPQDPRAARGVSHDGACPAARGRRASCAAR